jgi:hypothetical protein
MHQCVGRSASLATVHAKVDPGDPVDEIRVSYERRARRELEGEVDQDQTRGCERERLVVWRRAHAAGQPAARLVARWPLTVRKVCERQANAQSGRRPVRRDQLSTLIVGEEGALLLCHVGASAHQGGESAR